MRKLLLIPLFMAAFVAASGIYFSGKAPAIAYADGEVPTTIEGWLAEMNPTYLKEQFAHFFKNQDSQTETQKGILEQEKIQAEEAVKQTEEMKRQTEEVGKLAAALQKLADMCGCQLPWTLPRTGGGGSHHHNPTEATATPTKTPDPQCSGTVYRWCEDGNVLVTICDGKRLEDVHCAICREASEEGKAYCAAPTATSTSTPGPTPIPPTGTPPPLVKTPNPGCPEAPHWVCDGAGNWLWKACGVTLCTTTCTLGCSSVPGVCKTMVLTPVSVATVTPTPIPPTATKTAVPVYPTATPIEICDGGTPGHLVPCPPKATKTSGPGPSATRTPTGTAAPWSSPTPIPPTATGLPIATSTKTPGWAIPTATLTGPPTITPISNSLCDVDAPTASKLLSVDGRMHLDPIGGDNCGFKSNSKFGTQFLVRCAFGWICTLDLLGTANGVYVSPGKYVVDGDVMSSWTFVIQAGTFRKKSGYWPGDAVHNRCSLLMNERVWGLEPIQGPSFEVWPLGFSCSNPALITTKSGRVCPAFVSSDVPYNTYPLLTEGPNSNGCKLPSQTDQRVGYVPDGWTLNDGTDHPSGSFWQGNEGTLRPQ